MNWHQLYGKAQRPTPEEFDAYMASPLWHDLRIWVEETYNAAPVVEHSCCSLAPGWNMKYRKGSKSICTLYPGFPSEERFTALVVVSAKDADQAEALLLNCDPYIQELYRQTAGESKWLMIDVSSAHILEDTKALMSIRVKPPRQRPNH